MAEALPAELPAVVAQHLPAFDAPLQVVGRIGQAAFGHCGPYADLNDSGTFSQS